MGQIRTNQEVLVIGTNSFDSYELADVGTGAQPATTLGSTNSYEFVALPSLGTYARRCYACGSDRYADDGVCLICHPRPWQDEEGTS